MSDNDLNPDRDHVTKSSLTMIVSTDKVVTDRVLAHIPHPCKGIGGACMEIIPYVEKNLVT